jgi:Family of unknown function (DUF5681)
MAKDKITNKKTIKKEISRGLLPVVAKTENSVNIQKEDKRKNMPHLFQKGVSGNPAGKPKGTPHFKTIILNALLKVGAKNAKGEEYTNDVLIIRALLDKALAGDIEAIKILLDRTDGKPHQSITSENINIERTFEDLINDETPEDNIEDFPEGSNQSPEDIANQALSLVKNKHDKQSADNK